MNDTLSALILLQWVVLLALGVGLVGLARQVGVLHARIGPAGALMLSKTPVVGEPSPQMRLPGLDGGEVSIGGPSADGRSTLLMFVSPDCRVCAAVLPIVKSLAARERIGLVFASDGVSSAHGRFRLEKGLVDYPYVISRDLGLSFGIGRLPYAVLIAPDGIIVGQGLVNSREHLESLFEAHRLGVASIQDFLAAPPKAADTASLKIAKR